MQGIEMPVTFILVIVLGAVGVIDVGYYHLLKLRLYRVRGSRYEQVAHTTRGVLYVAMLCLTLPGTPRGAWVSAGLAIFVLDTLNTVVDTWLEKASRERGLDHGEYMVHVAGSVLAGATAVAFLFEAWPHRSEPTAWIARSGSSWLTLPAWFFVGSVGSVVVVELGLHLAAMKRGFR